MDPPTQKMLPVEVDVVEHLVDKAQNGKLNEHERAVADLTMIAFYYLLRVGEYTVKGTGPQEPGATQTQPFKMKDIAFFGRNSRGRLYCIPPNAREFDILHATNATISSSPTVILADDVSPFSFNMSNTYLNSGTVV